MEKFVGDDRNQSTEPINEVFFDNNMVFTAIDKKIFSGQMIPPK